MFDHLSLLTLNIFYFCDPSLFQIKVSENRLQIIYPLDIMCVCECVGVFVYRKHNLLKLESPPYLLVREMLSQIHTGFLLF